MSASTTAARPPGGTAANAEEAGRRVEEIIDHLTAEGDSKPPVRPRNWCAY
ncbi:hypothetical protein ACFQ0Q_03135 [Streptomyces aureus]